jgi:hypothetical protein
VVQENVFFFPNDLKNMNLKQCEKQMNPYKVVGDTTEDDGI